MTRKEKVVLKDSVQNERGQISEGEMYEYADGNQKIIEHLLIWGYLERVSRPQIVNGQVAPPSIYYVVTEKGLNRVGSMPKRIWFNFKSQSTVWVGIISVIVSITALITTIYFLYYQNKRQNEDFILRNRPYLVIASTEVLNVVPSDAANYKAIIKNVGILPAHVINTSIGCAEAVPLNVIGKTIIGNGEQTNFDFSITSNLGAGAICALVLTYETVGIDADKFYTTEYKMRFTGNGEVIHEDALIR